MDQVSKPRRHRHILDFPNELLHMIISYIPLRIIVLYSEENGRRRYVSQILILMSTCHCFRAFCYEIDFWLGEEFTISSLLPKIYSPQPQMRCEWSLITALLNDERVFRVLAQRNQWTFTNEETMLLILNKIDRVHQNIRNRISGRLHSRNSMKLTLHFENCSCLII
jgi:hypothetical protein